MLFMTILNVIDIVNFNVINNIYLYDILICYHYRNNAKYDYLLFFLNFIFKNQQKFRRHFPK